MKLAFYSLVILALSNIRVMGVPSPVAKEESSTSRELSLRPRGDLEKRVCGPICWAVLFVLVSLEVGVSLIVKSIADNPTAPYQGDTIYQIENPDPANIPIWDLTQTFVNKVAADVKRMTGEFQGVVMTERDRFVEIKTQSSYWFGAEVFGTNQVVYFEVFVANQGSVVVDALANTRYGGDASARSVPGGNGFHYEISLGWDSEA